MIRIIPIALLLAIWGALVAQPRTLLKNAFVVDPAKREILTRNLVLEGRLISQITPGVPDSFEGTVVDLTGKFVIPGLIDMHTHSFGNSSAQMTPEFFGTPGTAQRMLRCGVVAFLDLFNAEETIFAQRRQQMEGEFGGARILAAGPCLTATGGHCTEYGNWDSGRPGSEPRGALSFTDRGHYEHSRDRGSLLSWSVAEVGA